MSCTELFVKAADLAVDGIRRQAAIAKIAQDGSDYYEFRHGMPLQVPSISAASQMKSSSKRRMYLPCAD